MPEIGTKVREGGDDVEIGVEYHIDNVEIVTTDVKAFAGIRVVLVDKKKDTRSVMLWQRPVTSPESKLGAFISLLGSNTDKWLGHKIIFRDWRQGARLVELAK
ncbi:MAG: hypothetical protein KKD77_22685 [Gammaproteobacteria bacterium]|nr:hypothetical protein [Gammaproteobacteria bacterium]